MSKEDIVYGIHAAESMLTKAAEQVLTLYCDQERGDPRMQHLEQLISRLGMKVQRVPRQQLDKMASGAQHQGVVVVCRVPGPRREEDLYDRVAETERPFLLVLDGVQDPHNLGACLRSADAAGVDAVIAPRDRAVSLTGTVSKVASGAAQWVPFYQVTNLARCLRALKDQGVWLVGTTGEAKKTLYEVDLAVSLAMVMGGEGKGMRRLTQEACDHLVRLPMAGSVESLNVSVATGVCLYEAVRQRRQA